MGLKEKVAVFGDVDLVYTFALVGFVSPHQSDGYRIPSDRLFGGRVENLRGIAAKDRGAARSVGEFLKERTAEFRALFAVQLHSGKACLLGGVTDVVYRFVNKDTDFFYLLRYLGDDGSCCF